MGAQNLSVVSRLGTKAKTALAEPQSRRGKQMGTGPKENEISGAIVDAACHVHKALGPGLLESVYKTVLAYELIRRGHQVERQVPIAIRYENLVFETGFKADLLVDGLVVVELKSVENLAPVHKKQTLTYVRLANKRLGLLLNFGAARMIDGITRVVHGLPDDG